MKHPFADDLPEEILEAVKHFARVSSAPFADDEDEVDIAAAQLLDIIEDYGRRERLSHGAS